MSLFKQYDILRVLERVEELMHRYFNLRNNTEDPTKAMDMLFDEIYPPTDSTNNIIRRNISEFINVSLIVYPESEKIKYFIKMVILNKHKGIRKGSKDDHEINRKLYLCYKSLRSEYRADVDSFSVEDIDRLGYWESLSSPLA